MPTGLPVDMAALTEPLAVGVHAVAKSRIAGGDAALVLGLGPVGLACIAELRMRGIGPIVAADFSPKRRALAEQLGADVVVDPRETPAIEAWRQIDGVRPLVIFEAVGVPGMIEQAMRMAPKDARILVVGACMQEDRIHPMLGIGRELSIQFALAYTPAEFGEALTAIADGKVDLVPLAHRQGGRRRRAAGVRTISATPSSTPRSSWSPASSPHGYRERRVSPRGPSRGAGSFRPMSDTFPRQYARTQRFTLGEPRNVTVSRRRTASRLPAQPRRRRPGELPVDPVDRRRRRRRLVADPVALLASADADIDAELPAEERARRERMREGAGGITAFATDRTTHGRRVHARRSAVRRRPAQRGGPRAARRRPGVRPTARPARHAGSPT